MDYDDEIINNEVEEDASAEAFSLITEEDEENIEGGACPRKPSAVLATRNYGTKYGNTVYCQGITGTIQGISNVSGAGTVKFSGTVMTVKRRPGRTGYVYWTVKSKPLSKPIIYYTPCKLRFQ